MRRLIIVFKDGEKLELMINSFEAESDGIICETEYSRFVIMKDTIKYAVIDRIEDGQDNE